MKGAHAGQMLSIATGLESQNLSQTKRYVPDMCSPREAMTKRLAGRRKANRVRISILRVELSFWCRVSRIWQHKVYFCPGSKTRRLTKMLCTADTEELCARARVLVTMTDRVGQGCAATVLRSAFGRRGCVAWGSRERHQLVSVTAMAAPLPLSDEKREPSHVQLGPRPRLGDVDCERDRFIYLQSLPSSLTVHPNDSVFPGVTL